MHALKHNNNHKIKLDRSQFYPEGTIVTGGFSKWASAGGWRVGYGVFAPALAQLRDAVRCAASNTYSCAPAPMQAACAKVMEK